MSRNVNVFFSEHDYPKVRFCIKDLGRLSYFIGKTLSREIALRKLNDSEKVLIATVLKKFGIAE